MESVTKVIETAQSSGCDVHRDGHIVQDDDGGVGVENVETSAIWSQDEESVYASGNVYDYQDTKAKNILNQKKKPGDLKYAHIPIIYEGSKTGRGNQFILPNALYFVRRRRSDPFTFVGQVICVNQLITQTEEHPAKYQLLIDINVQVNNIKYNTSLKKLAKWSGSGCLKKSALEHLGYKLDPARKGASIQSGLNGIIKIDS